MEIRTKEAGGGPQTVNRLKVLEGVLNPQKVVQKGEQLTQRGRNAMTEAASQESDAEDAGAYAVDKVTDKARQTAAEAAAKAKQGAKKTVDTVRREIKERRRARNEGTSSGEGDPAGGRSGRDPEWERNRGNPRGEGASRRSANEAGAGRNGQGYAGNGPGTHGYRFPIEDMKLPGTEGGNTGTGSRFYKKESGNYGKDSLFRGGNAPAGKGASGAQAKSDVTVRVKEQSVKIAERRIRTAAEQTAKKAAKKAADGARKAAKRAARETAKTAAKTTGKAAKATAKTAKTVGEAVWKAVSAVIEKLAAACASGGPFVVIIIAAAVYIGAIMYKIGDIADKLLSIWSLGGAIVWEGDVENLEEMIKDAHLEPNPAIVAVNDAYHDRLIRIIKNNKHDEVVLENPDPDWNDILGFWAAWQLCENDGEFPDFAEGGMAGLSKVFNDMVRVEFEVAANREPDESGSEERSVLTITAEQLSIAEMAELYELGDEGEQYIEMMTEGGLFELVNIFTKYLDPFEMPKEEPKESESGGRPGGGGSF